MVDRKNIPFSRSFDVKVRAEKCIEIWCEWAWKAVCHQKQVETPSMDAQQLVAVPEDGMRASVAERSRRDGGWYNRSRKATVRSV